MDKKGIVDVSITSWIVLIAVFFLMAIFVFISSGINLFGNDKKADYSINLEEVDSRVMASLFLNDFVEIEGQKVKIEDVLKEMGLRADGKDAVIFIDKSLNELTKFVEEKFNKDYSCNMKNSLFVEQILSVSGAEVEIKTETIWSHIAYPDAYGRNPLGKEEIIFVREKTIAPPEGSYYLGLPFDEENKIDIYAKRNVEGLRC